MIRSLAEDKLAMQRPWDHASFLERGPYTLIDGDNANARSQWCTNPREAHPFSLRSISLCDH